MAFTLNEIEAANAGEILRNNPGGGVGDDYDEICTVLEDPERPGEKVYFEERLPGEEPTADTPRYPVAITHPRGTICKYTVLRGFTPNATAIVPFSDDNRKLYEVIEYGGTELCMGTTVGFVGLSHNKNPLCTRLNVISPHPEVYASTDHPPGRPDGLVSYGKVALRYIGHRFNVKLINAPSNNIPVVFYTIVRPFDGIIKGVGNSRHPYNSEYVCSEWLRGDFNVEWCRIYVFYIRTQFNKIGTYDGEVFNDWLLGASAIPAKTHADLLLSNTGHPVYHESELWFFLSHQDRPFHFTLKANSLYSL